MLTACSQHSGKNKCVRNCLPSSRGLDAAFAAGKAKGNQVWAQAMALRGPVATAPVPPPAISVQFQFGR